MRSLDIAKTLVASLVLRRSGSLVIGGETLPIRNVSGLGLANSRIATPSPRCPQLT